MISTKRRPSASSISVPVVIISIVALIYPFFEILYMFFPINLFGKNLWAGIPILAILIPYISTFFRGRGNIVFNKSDIVFFVIAVVSGFIFTLRESIYTEQRSLLDIRYIFSSIIFLLAAKRFVNGEKNIKLLSWVLIVTCFIQAILGILHAHLFPELIISHNPDDPQDVQFIVAERTREGGTLGESIYANVIVCGMFLLVAKHLERASIRSTVLLIFSIMVMLYAVLLSGSRYPIIVASLVTLFLFSRVCNLKQMMAVCLVLFVALAFMLANEEGVELYGILRFDENDGGRVEKLLLALTILQEDSLHFLIGASSAVIRNASTPSGLSVSDNSYMLILLQFGSVFAVCYFAYLVVFLKQFVFDKISLCFMIYMLIGLGITNSILWEPWFFIAFLVSSIMYHGAPAYRAKCLDLKAS